MRTIFLFIFSLVILFPGTLCASDLKIDEKQSVRDAVKKGIEIGELSLKVLQDFISTYKLIKAYFSERAAKENDGKKLQELAFFLFDMPTGSDLGNKEKREDFAKYVIKEVDKKIESSGYYCEDLKDLTNDLKKFDVDDVDQNKLRNLFDEALGMHLNMLIGAWDILVKEGKRERPLSYSMRTMEDYYSISSHYESLENRHVLTTHLSIFKVLYQCGLQPNKRLIALMPKTFEFISGDYELPDDISEFFLDGALGKYGTKTLENSKTELIGLEGEKKQLINNVFNEKHSDYKSSVTKYVVKLKETKNKRDSIFSDVFSEIQLKLEKIHQEEFKKNKQREKNRLKKLNRKEKKILEKIEEITHKNFEELENNNNVIESKMIVDNIVEIRMPDKKLSLKERKELKNTKKALKNSEKFKINKIEEFKNEDKSSLDVEAKTRLLRVLTYDAKNSDFELLKNILNKSKGIQSVNNERILTLFNKLGIKEKRSRHGDYRKLTFAVKKADLENAIKNEKRLNEIEMTYDEAKSLLERIEGDTVIVSAMSFRPETPIIGHNLATIYMDFLCKSGIGEDSFSNYSE